MMRATTSIGPPAANGTTIVTGWAGQSCAPADDASAAHAIVAATIIRFAHVRLHPSGQAFSRR